jgi:hypothetical protein
MLLNGPRIHIRRLTALVNKMVPSATITFVRTYWGS